MRLPFFLLPLCCFGNDTHTISEADFWHENSLSRKDPAKPFKQSDDSTSPRAFKRVFPQRIRSRSPKNMWSSKGFRVGGWSKPSWKNMRKSNWKFIFLRDGHFPKYLSCHHLGCQNPEFLWKQHAMLQHIANTSLQRCADRKPGVVAPFIVSTSWLGSGEISPEFHGFCCHSQTLLMYP